jgi:trk system potassium uptake protein TrkH
VAKRAPREAGDEDGRAWTPRRPFTRVISLRPRAPRLAQAERGFTLIGGLAALAILGTFLLWLPISGVERPLTLNEAFFTAVSAVATTGLNVITPGRDLSLFGQIVLLLLMQLGGIGFMVMAITVFRLVGKRVTFAERLSLRDSLGLLSAGQILSLTTRALLAVLAIEAVGAFVLWLNWMPRYGAGWGAYLAIFHSVSAFTNASFDLFAGSPTAAAGFPTDTLTLLTLAALIILGGIGIPVISDLLLYRQRRRFSLHTRLTLIVSGVLIVVGTILFFLAEVKFRGVFSDESVGRLLLLSFFHSVASRTSGFVVSARFSQLEPANGLLLIVLMFIGASPASMGGGITTSTFAVLVLAMWSFVRGYPNIRAGRRTIPFDLIYKAVAITTGAVMVIMVVTWLLLYTQENVTLAAALVEAVSAFSTSGYSLALTERLNLFGQLLIAGLMFFGRIGTLTIIVALARPSVPPAVNYPEERVLMG